MLLLEVALLETELGRMQSAGDRILLKGNHSCRLGAEEKGCFMFLSTSTLGRTSRLSWGKGEILSANATLAVLNEI